MATGAATRSASRALSSLVVGAALGGAGASASASATAPASRLLPKPQAAAATARALHASPAASLAKAPAKAKKGDLGPRPKAPGKLDVLVATGCGIKKGEADPALKPDEEYPAWLWDFEKALPGLGELRRAGDALPEDLAARKRHLEARDAIKRKNAMSAKG